ncbi:MAG: response regulator [Rhodothermales bacterium]
MALVIDDDPELRAYIVRRLAPYYETREAGTCSVALDCLEEHVPDVILLDIGLPDTDGATFFHVIRSRPEWANIPILLMTGFSLAMVFPGQLPLRTAYLPKPFTSRSLLLALEGLTEK